MPHLLRPSPIDEYYTFIAECYVHGCMDGEVLIATRKAEQPEYDTADVSWLERLHQGEVRFATKEFRIR